MKHVKTGAVLAVLALLTECAGGVAVSSFGYDPEDSTEIIQRAIDSGVPKLIFDRQAGPWITRPLVGRSNLEIVFEDGVELQAKRGEFRGLRDYLFRCECVTNVTIRGLGKKGGTFRMWKSDYLDPKQSYAKSEWRYTLRLCGVENVLVENMSFRSSGGDGIVIGSIGGVNSHNVTVRRCVCDDNHRQGISVCSGDGILIEDTVLSNTKGTPPEADIDFEPDRPDEALANITLRNVVSTNNAGIGFEIYCQQLRDFSKPVSLRLENCKSIGNRKGTQICAANVGNAGIAKGLVEFVGCEFAESRMDAIRIIGTPAGALDVAFRDCTVRNAKSDVCVEAGGSFQGPPDGIALENLTIFQPEARPWFRRGCQSFGPMAENVRGDVTVVTPDGRRERTVLDRKWVETNLPAVAGGAMPAPRVVLPAASSVAAVETKPGEMADLSPVALIFGGDYLLYVPKAGPVKLVARQWDVTGRRPASTKKTIVTELLDNGKKGRRWELATPGFEHGELSFEAKDPGFYALTLPNDRTRTVLEKSSVPVAVDVREKEHLCAGLDGKPFSLWFFAPGDRRISFYAAGDEYNRFAARIWDHAGKEFGKVDCADGMHLFAIPAKPETKGLWRVDFRAAERPAYDWVRLDFSGTPGVLFLSSEKYWK